MHSTSSIPLPQNPLSSNFARNQISFPPFHYKKPKTSSHVVTAQKRDAYDGKDEQRIKNGRLVDENMIVLRMRIRNMELSEGKYDDVAPSYWMEWEKRWCDGSYDNDICQAMGMLQRFFLDARPSFVVGFIAFLMLSVSTSSAFLLGHLLEFLT